MAEKDPRILKGGTYFDAYGKLFAFHMKHINARTDEEWLACAGDMGQFITPFEVELAVALVNELERDSGKETSNDANT